MRKEVLFIIGVVYTGATCSRRKKPCLTINRKQINIIIIVNNIREKLVSDTWEGMIFTRLEIFPYSHVNRQNNHISNRKSTFVPSITHLVFSLFKTVVSVQTVFVYLL